MFSYQYNFSQAQLQAPPDDGRRPKRVGATEL